MAAASPLGRRRRWLKHTRWSVLKRPERLSDRQAETLTILQRENARLYRAYYSDLRIMPTWRRRPALAAVIAAGRSA